MHTEKPIRLSADSSADMPSGLAQRIGLATIAIYVNLKGHSYKDMLEITPDEIFSVFESEKIIPTTSAVPVGDYEEHFRAASEDGKYAVIHFCIGGAISSSYQNACIAAAELEDVHVIDSESMTVGLALQLLHADKLRTQGLRADELAEECNSWKKKVRTTALLGSPTYIHKSGRCSAASALGANLLNIRPVLQMVNGQLGMYKKLRGRPAAVQQQYLEDLLAEPETIDGSVAFLYHTGVSPEEFEAAQAYVKGHWLFNELIIGQAGSVTSTHIGDKCLLLMFARK